MAMPGAVPGSGKTGLVKFLGSKKKIHGQEVMFKPKYTIFSGAYLSVSKENDLFCVFKLVLVI